MPTTVTLAELFNTYKVTGVISRVKPVQLRFCDFWGMLPGGPNVSQVGGQIAGWDIIDATRQTATIRPFGTGPATVTPRVTGHGSARMLRAHEKVKILQDKIFRQRGLGQDLGTVDIRGQSYVARQEAFLASRIQNNREFMVSRMCRGGFGLILDGDEWTLVEKSASGYMYNVDYQIPATNLTTLDMLGEGAIASDWGNASTGTPISDCMEINRAFEVLHGRPLRHVWLSSILMLEVLKTAEVAAFAGSANTPFRQFMPTPGVSDRAQDGYGAGIPNASLEVILTGLPWVTWHVYDGVMDVNGTTTAFLPNDKAIFLPDPDRQIAEMWEGSEVVAENVMDAGTERFGVAAWVERCTQPTGWEMISLDICLPVLFQPKCIAYGTMS